MIPIHETTALLGEFADFVSEGLQLGSGSETAVPRWSCDHRFRFSTSWCARRGIPGDESIGFFRRFGGYCDCEIMLNVAGEAENIPEIVEHWHALMNRVDPPEPSRTLW